MIGEICQVSRSRKGRNFDHYRCPSISSSQSLWSGRREGIWFPSRPSQLSLQDKVGSHWRIPSYLCAFNTLSWLSSYHATSPIGVRDVRDVTVWGPWDSRDGVDSSMKDEKSTPYQSYHCADISTWFKLGWKRERFLLPNPSSNPPSLLWNGWPWSKEVSVPHHDSYGFWSHTEDSPQPERGWWISGEVWRPTASNVRME